MGKIETRYAIETTGASYMNEFESARCIAFEVSISDKQVKVNGSTSALGWRSRFTHAEAEHKLHPTPEAAWAAFRINTEKALQGAKARVAMLTKMLEWAEAEYTRIVQ